MIWTKYRFFIPFYSQMTSEFKDVPHRLRPFVQTVSTWLLLPGVRRDALSAGTRVSVWTCVSTSPGDHPAGEVLFLNVLNTSRTFWPLFPLEVNGASGFSTSWTTLLPSVLSPGHPAGMKWRVSVVRACISDDSGSWGSSNEPRTRLLWRKTCPDPWDCFYLGLLFSEL